MHLMTLETVHLKADFKNTLIFTIVENKGKGGELSHRTRQSRAGAAGQ